MLRHTPPRDQRRARSTASKEKIAQAAEKIVLSQGRAGLTTQALVKESGLSERTIFNHFKKLDDALTHQLSAHLEPCIDEPPFPSGLSLEEIPQALVQHFHEAADNEKVQKKLISFMTLGTALVEEDFDRVAKEATLSLGIICDALCSQIDQLYPDLSLDQSLSLGLFTYNLLTAYIFAFLRFAQELDGNIFEGKAEQKTIDFQQLAPHVHAYIDQVATGIPSFTTDGQVLINKTS